MNDNLYLFKPEKDKRTRIELFIQNSVATATIVTCYNPTGIGSFNWEIKNLSWCFEDHQQLQEYWQFIQGFKQDEKRFFKEALSNAVEFRRKPSARRLQAYAVKPKLLKTPDYNPLLSKEEVIMKIQSARQP